ncbi:MAG TPA: helix-turn-helix transcriptional regulator [Pseudonocardiaceae bacterium]|nr:helix-turn-helix transcriptional regulator [Pseudonocardiaceae bacterium]
MTTVGSAGGDQDTGPTVRRMILGTQLRRLRERAELTRAEAGYSIRASESKISRLELGRVGFKERDVTDLLTLYGVDDRDERQQFLKLVGQSNRPGWWHRYNDLMPKWFEDFVGLEEAAARIQTYELQFVPGLLQTEEYARAVASHGRPERVNDDVERRVALRVRRQSVLAGPQAPRFWAVIDESVLHRPLGGRAVLRAQLDRILELSAQPHISVQVVPYEISGYAAEGAFTLLRFAEPELPNIAYVEHLAGALYLEKPDEIEVFSRALDRLAVDAERPDRSRQLLSKLRAEI